MDWQKVRNEFDIFATAFLCLLGILYLLGVLVLPLLGLAG
jgi:hypothetical protein